MTREQFDPSMTRRQLVQWTAGLGTLAALGGVFGGPDAVQAAWTRRRQSAPRPGGRLAIGVTAVVPPTFGLGFSGGTQGNAYHPFAWPLYQATPSDSVEPNPGLAASYSASEDRMLHTFVLRDGMTFHDGSPITAEAVVEVLRSQSFADHPLRDEGSYNYNYAGFGNPSIIEAIDVVDERTLSFQLLAARNDIRASLTQHHIFNPAIMSRPEYGIDLGALRDLGSGPFRVTNFSPGAFVEMERYEDFADEVLLDALRFENFADSAALALAVRGGEIDAAFAVRKADQESLAGDPEFQPIVYEPSFNVFFVFYTPFNEALRDERVRRAIGMAMNRPAYRDAFFSSGTAARSTQGILHPERIGYNDDLAELPYDPDGARSLLDEAGASAISVRLSGYESGSHVPEMASLMEAIQADLGAVGINADVTISDYATYLATRYEYDGWINSYAPESSAFNLTLLYRPPAAVGDAWPETDPRAGAEFQQLVDAGLSTTDPDEQAASFEELQRVAHEELSLIIPLAQVSSSMIARTGVHDVKMSTLNPEWELVWVDDSGS